jgi:DNA polymerase I-like protein with 3'-5' exonuclease and polymerase domains
VGVSEDLRLGVRQIHDHLALPLLPIVQELGLKGLPFDAQVRDTLVRDAVGRLGEIDTRLLLAGINSPNSPKKLADELLALGVPLSKKTASGAQFTVDLDVLGRIHHNYNVSLKTPKFPFLPDLIARKRIEKARANLESLVPCLDGRVRTSLRSTGTETGRYSSSGLRWCNLCKQPNHGTNLQNIGKNNKELGINVKDCFVAPPGYVFWEIDYSMLELRLMAHLAGVTKLIERMETPGIDVHTANTHALFEGRYSDALRTLAKNFFYALQYGGSEGAIQIALAKKGEYLDQEYIRSLMLKIYTEYPEIALWQQSITAECVRLSRLGLPRIARNAYGGCRVLLGGDPTKEWLSTVVQGTAAYTMSLALIRMSEEVRAPIVAQVHDAYYGLSPESRWREEMQAVMDEMTRPIWINDKFVTLPADAKMGRSWSTMKAI